MLVIYRNEFWELITKYNISREEFETLKKNNPTYVVEIKSGNKTKIVPLSKLSLYEKWRNC